MLCRIKEQDQQLAVRSAANKKQASIIRAGKAAVGRLRAALTTVKALAFQVSFL